MATGDQDKVVSTGNDHAKPRLMEGCGRGCIGPVAIGATLVFAVLAGFFTVFFVNPFSPRRLHVRFVVEPGWHGAELLVEGARRIRLQHPETQVFVDADCVYMAVRQQGCRALLLEIPKRLEKDGAVHLRNSELEALCR